MNKVSVIITAHNYAKYLPQCIDSVLNQTFDNYEIVIVNDGSTDHTAEVLERYAKNDKIKIVNQEGVGLSKAANKGIRESIGKYIIRLDADDYFDENILLILSNVLDKFPEYGMVYPDYYRVNKYGEIIDQVRQLKVNDEVKLLDRSALAAGALYRRSCYDAIGGYNEELEYQEDYDFWIRFIDKFNVHNVQLPLMFYRKHAGSMSTNAQSRIIARQYVKQKFVEKERNIHEKKILCVLPMVADNHYEHKLPVKNLNERPLLSYVVEEAKKVNIFDRIIIDTEDQEIAEVAVKYGAEVPFLRPMSLAKRGVWPVEILKQLTKRLYKDQNYIPDLILMAFYSNPFIKKQHMEEAINTLLIHNCDSVISVTKDLKFHWRRSKKGLKPVLYPRKLLSKEKEITFEERGGIYALQIHNLKTDLFLGESISFIEIDEVEALKIDSDYTYWIADQMLKNNYS